MVFNGFSASSKTPAASTSPPFPIFPFAKAASLSIYNTIEYLREWYCLPSCSVKIKYIYSLSQFRMDNPGIQSSDLPHSLQLDSLSGVAEDASTLAAAQAQQQHQHEIQEHVPSAESTDAQSLHPLQTAIETLDSYSIQQHEGPNEARSFREPYNNNILVSTYIRWIFPVTGPLSYKIWRISIT